MHLVRSRAQAEQEPCRWLEHPALNLNLEGTR